MDIQQINKYELRSTISIVLQDVNLFEGTIDETKGQILRIKYRSNRITIGIRTIIVGILHYSPFFTGDGCWMMFGSIIIVERIIDRVKKAIVKL